MKPENNITVEIQQYPNGPVAVFRSGAGSVYAPLSEAQHLIDSGNYSWREVCDLPTNRAVQVELQRRHDGLQRFAGQYAAKTAYSLGSV